MKIPEEKVKEFIQIHKKTFGETLKYGEAELKINRLLDLLKLLSS